MGPILLVEDNDNDVFFLQRAINKAGLNLPMHVAEDGKQALEYLEGKGKYADREAYPLPRLVLLDLKLPMVDGFGVLKWIRSHPALQSLVVVMLTSSHLEVDITAAYRLGANSFLVKTSSADELVKMMQLVNDYWFKLNRMPPSNGTDSARPADEAAQGE